jgi:chitosanase
LLRRTVYRPEALQELVGAGNWALTLPVTVRGVLIDADVLAGRGVPWVERSLMLASPELRGDDVSTLQRALVARGEAVSCDGVFGDVTDRCLRDFQSRNGMVVDGVAGPVTRAALGLA